MIGPDKMVKLTITSAASTGRNFEEILRVLDSLHLASGFSVATPVNWPEGEDAIIVTAISDADAKAKFPEGFRADSGGQALPALHAAAQPLRRARPARVRLAGGSGLALAGRRADTLC